jgi:anti-sigma regulatory factor (Ser/Thr protein kinase)
LDVIADARATHPVLVDRSGHHTCDEYDPDRVLTDYNRPLTPPPLSAIERAVDPDSLDSARWFITTYGQKMGLEAHQLVDLQIAATELVTASIVHGGGTGAIRLWADQEHLICEVTGAGLITDLLVGRRPAAENGHHGRGLLMVNQIVDLLRMHTGAHSTTVRIHMRLPSEASPAAE